MPSKSLGLFLASLSLHPLFCLEFVEITNKIETCLVAVAVAAARPPPDEYETDSRDDFSDREDEDIACACYRFKIWAANECPFSA